MKRHYKENSRRNLFVVLFTAFWFFLNVAYSQQQRVQNGVLRLKVTEAYATKLQQSSANGRQSFNILNTGSPQLNVINARYHATTMKRVFPDGGKFEAKHRKHGLHLWYEVQIDSSTSALAAREAYRSVPEVQRVENIYKKNILDYDRKKFRELSPLEIKNAIRPPDGSQISNDPLLNKQWHYNNYGQTNGTVGVDIDLLKAWTIETGKKEVIVAIVDGGIEFSHPDLSDNIWTNEGEIPGNGIDDDNNGFIDDIHGFSFADWRPTIKPHPHGTHVAGTVAAVNNNGIGVSGVAGGSGKGDGVRLMSCGVFKELMPGVEIGGGFENAYVYAADNGAVISQNSWGYNGFGVYDQVVLDAIDYFIEEAGTDENGIQTGPMKGGIVIFSTGNNGYEGLQYPACYDRTLAVASVVHDNVRANYSNFGSWVDVSAPGGDVFAADEQGVLSTSVNGGYAYKQGTSMAAPHISGTAALLVSHYGGTDVTPAMIRQRITSTTNQIYLDNPTQV